MRTPSRLYHRKAYFESDNFCNIRSVDHHPLPAKLSQLLATPGGYAAREGSAVSKPHKGCPRRGGSPPVWHMHADPPRRPRVRVHISSTFTSNLPRALCRPQLEVQH